MGTDITIGRIDAADYAEFRRAFSLTFGISQSEEELGRVRPWHELGRSVAARADGRIVGTSGAYSFDLALPWAPPAGCAAITAVSVRADHRRRGVLTRMMRQLLDDADERGEPFAALWASEAPIYGRFGFGPAVPTVGIEVDRAHGRLRRSGDVGDVRLIDAEEAAERFPPIYAAARRHRPGMLGFGAAWWQRVLEDDPAHRDGAGEKRYALLDDRGFAIYRLKEGWSGGVPNGLVEVHELIALDPEALAGLWQFVLDTDLGSTVRATRRPLDDPLPVLLHDEGRARVGVEWPLYLCLVDLPAALTARGYAVDDTLTVRVHDRFRPRNDGVWRLQAAGGRASCEAGNRGADLELDAEVLAALVLGGQRASRYAAAGRLQGHTSDAVARCDRLFATDVAPWNHVMF